MIASVHEPRCWLGHHYRLTRTHPARLRQHQQAMLVDDESMALGEPDNAGCEARIPPEMAVEMINAILLHGFGRSLVMQQVDREHRLSERPALL